MAKNYRQRLQKTPVATSLPRPRLQCIACSSRKSTNANMDEQIEQGSAPPDYSGFTYAVVGDQLLISQIHQGRQLGAVVAPIKLMPDLLDSIADYVERVAADQLPEGIVDEDPEEEEASGEEEEDESEPAA